MAPWVAPTAAAVLLAAVHFLAGLSPARRSAPRSRWLSFAGGVSVAYIFVHLLPELARRAGPVSEHLRVSEGIFSVGLLGLVVFYGLERWARGTKETPADGEPACTPARVFWLHLVSFSLYNGIVGYLLPEEHAAGSLWLFTGALGLHFFVNDDALRRHHRHRYHRAGRWVLGGAVLLGVGLSWAWSLGESTVGMLMAFLAGGVILNTLKEEVPEERASRFWTFALGAAGYAGLILLLGR